MTRSLWSWIGFAGIACAGAWGCSDDGEGGEPGSSSSGGTSSDGGKGSTAKGGESSDGGTQSGSKGGAPGNDGSGGDDSATGGDGAQGQAGNDSGTCDEASLLAALPGVFEAALDSTPCLSAGAYDGALVDATYCDASECACEAALDWTVSLDGTTLTATATVSADIAMDYTLISSTMGTCAAAFSATLSYSGEVEVSEDGGLHTSLTSGDFAIDEQPLEECAAVNLVARTLIAGDVAEDLQATFDALDDAAIVASNACP